MTISGYHSAPLCRTMLALVAGLAACPAADLVGIGAAAEKVLHLEVRDGHISYYGQGQSWWQGTDNKIYHEPLDLALAAKPESYRLEPADGGPAIIPTRVGRKSKGADYNAPNASVPFILRHQLYLELPQPLVEGKTYTLVAEGMFANSKRTSFTIDATRTRSDTIRVNQIGFAPTAVKIAYLSHWLGDMGPLDLDHLVGKPFQVIEHASGKAVFSGTIAMRLQHDQQITEAHNNRPQPNRSHTDIAECDFSDFSKPGIYRIAVPGIGCSFPFEIGEKPVQRAFHAAMKSLFYQRSGVFKELPDGRVYPRAHHPDINAFYYLPNVRTLHHSQLPKGNEAITAGKPVTGIWGWYNDASDWDGYPESHYRIPLQLMLLYQLQPQGFADGEIANRYRVDETGPWIEEGGNGLPDLLDEAAWLVRYGQRARAALKAQGLGTGGIPGYIGRDSMGGATYKGHNPSWDDRRPQAVTAENPTATMAYAASAAWYARCLEIFAATPAAKKATKKDAFAPGEIATWWKEATEAYDWAMANGHDDPVGNRPSNKGFRSIAAILLWQHTGDRNYAETVGRTLGTDDQSNYHIEADTPPTFYLAASLAAMTNGLIEAAGTEGGENIRKGVANLERLAKHTELRTTNEDMRYGSWDFGTGLGLGRFSTPKVLLQATMHQRTKDKRWLDTVQHSVSYVLGGNQLNQSRISMLGENPLNAGVHHLDAWVLNHTTHPVYTWEPLLGYVTYFGDKMSWVGGVGDHKWTFSSAYPAQDKSPITEMNFGNRESINGSEYTTPQNLLSMAYATGYLRSVHVPDTNAWKPDPTRPAVKLAISPAKGDAKKLLLSASGSNLDRVAYYYDWHYIGSASGPRFELTWDPANTNAAAGTKVRITAVGYDIEGTPSRPQPTGETEVTVP